MDHACRYWQCVENYGGQCFGSGCSLNPMPAPSELDAEDGDENTQEDT
jgi:hypothetical protein